MIFISILLSLYSIIEIGNADSTGKVIMSGIIQMDKHEESTNKIYVIDSLLQDTIFQKKYVNSLNSKQDTYSIELQYDKKYIIVFVNEDYGLVNNIYLSTVISKKYQKETRYISCRKILFSQDDDELIRFNTLTGVFDRIPVRKNEE